MGVEASSGGQNNGSGESSRRLVFNREMPPKSSTFTEMEISTGSVTEGIVCPRAVMNFVYMR